MALRRIGGWSSGSVLVLLGVLVVLVAPLPGFALDGLIVANLAFAAAVLVRAGEARGVLDFPALPTLLLLGALARLGLELAAARAILSHGEAGSVIRAVGSLVMSGSPWVGLAVFGLVTAVQYLVVVRGGERIAEVSARFALDALPGRQLALDAELRAGRIEPAEARRRRDALLREGQLQGAMDGAMKFVRGDVAVGVLVTAVNLFGGVLSGALLRGESWPVAFQHYARLALGQGIAAQLPALALGSAAALVLSRAGSAPSETPLSEAADALALCVPRDLAARLSDPERRALSDALARVVAEAARDTGVRFPAMELRFIEVANAAEQALLVRHRAVPLQATEVPSEAEPWWHPGTKSLAWLPPGEALSGGQRLGVVDALARFAAETLRLERTRWLDRDSVLALIEESTRESPQLRAAVLGEPSRLATVSAVLRGLAEEGVSLQPMRDLLEALANAPPGLEESSLLTLARRSVRSTIVLGFAPRGSVPVYLLGPELCQLLRERLGRPEAAGLPPQLGEEVAAIVKRRLTELPGAVLAEGDVRRRVWEVFRAWGVRLVVLSPEELPPSRPVEMLGTLEAGGL